MTIKIDNTSNIGSTRTPPVRLARGSRPGWRQTAVAFRAQVTTTVLAPPAPVAGRADHGLEQLTLFDTAPYLKGVK